MSPTISAAPQPLISVIIPTWNRANMVLDAIRSAQQQTWRHTQVIVVDDGSADGTAEVVSACPGITYLYQHHRGQAAARNLGLRHAQGDYVASLDSDDYWYPTFLEACMHGLEELAADFVFANYVKRAADGQRLRTHLERDRRWQRHSRPVAPGWYATDAGQSRRLFLETCPSPSSSVLFRRQPFRHGWNEDMHICDDWCLLLDSVIKEQSRVAFTIEPLWVKRACPDSISEGKDPLGIMVDDWYGDLKAMRRRFAGHLSEAEQAVMDRHELQWRLSSGRRRLLREGQRSQAANLIASALLADPAYVIRATGEWLHQRALLRLRSGRCGATPPRLVTS